MRLPSMYLTDREQLCDYGDLRRAYTYERLCVSIGRFTFLFLRLNSVGRKRSPGNNSVCLSFRRFHR